ncbi:hypothetical protein PRMUPPPA20_07680 [Xylanibacter ruminicola]|uniref:Uncharacterized protein n=1 Tax=Xylanibacter ruminicola TaxID=839 RepID=A0AA37MNN1_XYLRU|nr:hypothetical protein PRMUPPPA20_07680 [Xylanibacter ruminicola]
MKIFCILNKEKPMPLLKIIKFVGYLPLCAEKVLYLHSNFENKLIKYGKKEDSIQSRLQRHVAEFRQIPAS